MIYSRRVNLDKIGVTLSVACAIHCLLMPVLVIVMSVGVVSWLVDEQTELIILGVAGVIAGLSLWRGCRMHRRLSLWLIFIASAVLIVAGHLTGFSTPVSVHLHVAGGLCLAGTQLINLWLCKQCPACRTDRQQAQAG